MFLIGYKIDLVKKCLFSFEYEPNDMTFYDSYLFSISKDNTKTMKRNICQTNVLRLPIFSGGLHNIHSFLGIFKISQRVQMFTKMDTIVSTDLKCSWSHTWFILLYSSSNKTLFPVRLISNNIRSIILISM